MHYSPPQWLAHRLAPSRSAPTGALGTITDLSATGGNGQVGLSWTPAAGATSHQPQYREAASGAWLDYGLALGGAAGSVTIIGLSNGTLYECRILASDGTATTISNTVTAMPQAGSTVEPFFADDFESYPVDTNLTGHGYNGFSWSPPRYVRVSDTMAYTGSKSIRCRYGPIEQTGEPHMWAEQRFAMAPIQEVWVEFYIYIPENYYHDSPGNNKFFDLWGPNGYSPINMGGAVVFQTWPAGGGASNIDMGRYGPNSPYLQYPNVPGNRGRRFLNLDERGMWHRIRIHVKLSDVGQSNGIARLWKGDSLIVDVTGDENNSRFPETNVFTYGYLLGYDNSRFAVDTDFYIDDVKFFNQDPGWWL